MNVHFIPLEERYQKALEEAKQKLASLDVTCGRPINVKGLSGWVFEQTVRTCLEEELNERGITVTIQEQVSIGGRATIDFLVGAIAIEVKAAGFFSDDDGARYSTYRKRAEANGWHYLYLTLCETHRPYVESARKSFGDDKAFFLDQKDSWLRLVATVVRLLGSGPQVPQGG